MNLNDFEQLVCSRRAIRHFRHDPIDDDLLNRLVHIAHWAPSGYNLQPTHYVIVQDPNLRAQLHLAGMKQQQILDAPVTVVFTGDRRVVEHNFDPMIAMERQANLLNESYERTLRKYVSLGFDQGPIGLGWLWKATLLPFIRFATPIPNIPAVYKTHWLSKQVMLNAMVFMLAAHAAGLATVPMEGFDESRVKKVLNIPTTHIAPLIVPIGYAADNPSSKTRLPIEGFIHRNGW